MLTEELNFDDCDSICGGVLLLSFEETSIDYFMAVSASAPAK